MDLNSPYRFSEIRDKVQKKESLRRLYLEVYQKYLKCIVKSPPGKTLEIGSGAGFAKDIIPGIITSDVIDYPGIDLVLDATQMDFPNNSLSCICMFNVLHHIDNTPAFFNEALRCLIPGGLICMIEPYPGWIGAPIYRYLHHEDYDPSIKEWEFKSHGPVSDANNALPYVIFERDIMRFRRRFPNLSILRTQPHTPLRYWLTGGLKNWCVLPGWAFNFFTFLDKMLIDISPKFGSFIDIELMKI